MLGARGTARMYASILGLPFMDNGVYPQVLLTAVGMALGSAVLAALVPAWHSARIAPAIAMHSDPNLSLSGGRIPLVERALSPLLPSTFTFRIPLRNIFRARRRSIYTIIGIAFAMVVSVSTAAMFDSIDYLMDTAFTKVERWDMTATFESPIGGARIAEIARLAGVRRVEPAYVIPVTVAYRGREEDVALTGAGTDATFHGFQHAGGSSADAALAAGEMVLAESTAQRLGVAPGSLVEVDSPLIDEPIRVRVGSLSREILGQPAYASLKTTARVAGRSITTYNVVYLYADERRTKTIQDEIYDMPGVASVEIKSGLYERLLSMMEMFSFFGDVLLVFGGALAFAVVFTTFSANVTERTREIATMRTIGEDNTRISIMVTIENLMLALVALPLGIWLGLQAMDLIFASFETESYAIQAYVSPASVARISALMIAVVLVSEIGPVRHIFRLDLAEATKVME